MRLRLLANCIHSSHFVQTFAAEGQLAGLTHGRPDGNGQDSEERTVSLHTRLSENLRQFGG